MSFGRDGILYFFLKEAPEMVFFNMIEWWFASAVREQMGRKKDGIPQKKMRRGWGNQIFEVRPP